MAVPRPYMKSEPVQLCTDDPIPLERSVGNILWDMGH